jgi:hypothetical protein
MRLPKRAQRIRETQLPLLTEAKGLGKAQGGKVRSARPGRAPGAGSARGRGARQRGGRPRARTRRPLRLAPSQTPLGALRNPRRTPFRFGNASSAPPATWALRACDAPTDHIARGQMKAKRPFGAHVSFAPNSGVRADILGPPLWAKLGNRQAIQEAHDANSASNAFASFRSSVSKPSVNQP